MKTQSGDLITITPSRKSERRKLMTFGNTPRLPKGTVIYISIENCSMNTLSEL